LNIPSQSGKTTLESLVGLPRSTLPEQGEVPKNRAELYYKEIEGFKFDLLWHPNKKHNRLFVLFSGDAMRSKNNPPVFQRWSWANFFPGNCLYISDPALYLDDRLGLAWYAGTDRFDPMLEIVKIVRSIADHLEISNEEIYSYGSSGGGFAALRMAAMMEGAGAIAVNPQTVVTNYAMKNTDRYLRLCFNGRDRDAAIRDFPERLSLIHYINILKHRKIIYIQNELDEHHYEYHYKPFCEAMNESYDINSTTGNFRRLIFSHADGHKKAETQDVFSSSMQIVELWSGNKPNAPSAMIKFLLGMSPFSWKNWF
jgi:hypothetical protein